MKVKIYDVKTSDVYLFSKDFEDYCYVYVCGKIPGKVDVTIKLKNLCTDDILSDIKYRIMEMLGS